MKNINNGVNKDQGSAGDPSLLVFAFVAGILYLAIIIVIILLAIFNII
ncbi:hypothetical protein [Xanthomonas arboricola]|nr:hypothetical protein [Xanthomonas arboricola]